MPEAFSANQLTGLFHLSLYIIIIYFFRGLFSYLQNFLAGIFSIKSSSDLKKDIYSLILNSKPEIFYSKKNGEYVAIITDDINKIREMSFSFLTELLPSIITIICTLGYIFYLNWHLSLFVLFLIPVIGGIISFFNNKIREKAESIQNKLASNHSILHEVFINYPAIKIFALENKSKKDFSEIELHNSKDNLDIIKLISLQPSIIGVVQVLGICIIACYGGYQLFNKSMTLAELLSFGTALSLTIEPVIFITKSMGIISKSSISVKNAINLKNYLEKNIDKKERKIMSFDSYDISFKDLSFCYFNNSENILNSINLQIKQGEIISFSGENGSGKSTLIKLLLQLLNDYSGEIKIGENSISDYDLSLFRNNIKACFSEPFIFNGTIRDNILLENIDSKELDYVLEITKVNDFIKDFENGINYQITNSGNNLSSGQKQRIALARAILSKPKILILDEATSNLDLQAEEYIYKEIRNYLKDSTIIIINHRKQSISFVDRVINFENRKISEIISKI